MLALLAVAWLAGRGLMLVGDAPAPAAGVTGPAGDAGAAATMPPTHPEPTAPEQDAIASPQPAGEFAVPASAIGPVPPDERADAPVAATAGASSAAATSPPAVTPVATRVKVEADRFAALCSAVTVHLARAELASAAAAVAHLLTLPLTPAQRRDAEQAAATLLAAVQQRIADVDAALTAGRGRTAAAAFAEIAPFVNGSSALPLPASGAADWSTWQRTRLATDADLPAPRPLPRGRVVAAAIAEGVVRGIVVAADAGECTLRVERTDGVAFPTATVVQCEPDEPTADEAVDMALAAARHGDAALAGAWAIVAGRRGGASFPRLRRVLDALR